MFLRKHVRFHGSQYSHGKDVQGFDCSDHLEIVLQDGDGARESLMPAAAEERHASVEQDGGNERGVGNPTQAFNTALRAPCSDTKEYILKSLSGERAFGLSLIFVS